jgi:hypothetical protein
MRVGRIDDAPLRDVAGAEGAAAAGWKAGAVGIVDLARVQSVVGSVVEARRMRASMPAGYFRLSSSKTAAIGRGVASRAVGSTLDAGQLPDRRIDLPVLAFEPGGTGDAVLRWFFVHTRL